MKLDMKIFMVVLILGAILRLWGAFDFPGYMEDESIHVPAAISLVESGVTTDQHWFLPQLSSLILYCSLSQFGDTPLGRRITNILFGVCSVIVIYLIGFRLFPDSPVSLIAASLLALDPFHIYYSRTTFIEIPVSFFFLLFLYLTLEFTEKNRPLLPLAGIALGLTIATKAYFIFVIPIVIAFALHRRYQQKPLKAPEIFHFLATLCFLPLSIYLLSYFQWFDRGYSLPEFFQMKMDAVWHLQHLSIEQFGNRTMLEAGGKPWEWFLKPILFGEQLYSDGVKGQFLLKINNPPFRLMAIPALFIIIFHAWRKASIKEWFIPLLFIGCYALFLVVKRPMFSYSALAVLPFAYLAIAKAAVIVAQWANREKMIYTAFLCAVLAWGLFTFPLVSGRPVLLSLYTPVLSISKIIGSN